MNVDRSLVWGFGLLAGVGAVIGAYSWANRVQEFRGTLVDCREQMVPAVVGWPHIPAKLITASGWYALDFKNFPEWRLFLDKAKGRQVVVMGVLTKWRGQYLRGHLRITVTDMRRDL